MHKALTQRPAADRSRQLTSQMLHCGDSFLVEHYPQWHPRSVKHSSTSPTNGRRPAPSAPTDALPDTWHSIVVTKSYLQYVYLPAGTPQARRALFGSAAPIPAAGYRLVLRHCAQQWNGSIRGSGKIACAAMLHGLHIKCGDCIHFKAAAEGCSDSTVRVIDIVRVDRSSEKRTAAPTRASDALPEVTSRQPEINMARDWLEKHAEKIKGTEVQDDGSVVKLLSNHHLVSKGFTLPAPLRTLLFGSEAKGCEVRLVNGMQDRSRAAGWNATLSTAGAFQCQGLFDDLELSVGDRVVLRAAHMVGGLPTVSATAHSHADPFHHAKKRPSSPPDDTATLDTPSVQPAKRNRATIEREVQQIQPAFSIPAEIDQPGVNHGNKTPSHMRPLQQDHSVAVNDNEMFTQLAAVFSEAGVGSDTWAAFDVKFVCSSPAAQRTMYASIMRVWGSAATRGSVGRMVEGFAKSSA